MRWIIDAYGVKHETFESFKAAEEQRKNAAMYSPKQGMPIVPWVVKNEDGTFSYNEQRRLARANATVGPFDVSRQVTSPFGIPPARQPEPEPEPMGFWTKVFIGLGVVVGAAVVGKVVYDHHQMNNMDWPTPTPKPEGPVRYTVDRMKGEGTWAFNQRARASHIRDWIDWKKSNGTWVPDADFKKKG